MAAITALVAGLVLYTAVGAALSLNLGQINNRLANHYSRYPWILRQIGGNNPNAHRAGGLIMVSFGLLTLAWLGIQRVWKLPTLSHEFAVWTLLVVAMVGLTASLIVIRGRNNRLGDKW